MEVKLTPDLATFVEAGVAEGRYADSDEMVGRGLRLLREQEAGRQSFMTMLQEIEAQIDRGEVYTADEVMAEIDEIIAAAETHAAE